MPPSLSPIGCVPPPAVRYDLLCEGMENGGKGFGGPVFSAGEIEARFESTTGVALAAASERAAEAGKSAS